VSRSTAQIIGTLNSINKLLLNCAPRHGIGIHTHQAKDFLQLSHLATNPGTGFYWCSPGYSPSERSSRRTIPGVWVPSNINPRSGVEQIHLMCNPASGVDMINSYLTPGRVLASELARLYTRGYESSTPFRGLWSLFRPTL
jgi:hypothetical protein